MDDMGNIVGVAVAKLSLKKIMDDYGVVPENTNFGIKATAVRNLMVGNGIVVKEPNDKLITRKQLAKLATDGTVHLTCWMTTAQIDKSIKDEAGKVLFKEFSKIILKRTNPILCRNSVVNRMLRSVTLWV